MSTSICLVIYQDYMYIYVKNVFLVHQQYLFGFCIYNPWTHMALVLIGKDLVSEGSTFNHQNRGHSQVQGNYTHQPTKAFIKRQKVLHLGRSTFWTQQWRFVSDDLLVPAVHFWGCIRIGKWYFQRYQVQAKKSRTGIKMKTTYDYMYSPEN